MNLSLVEMTETGRPRAIRSVLLLIGAGLGFWGLLAGPAWFVAGGHGLIGLSVSAILCLVPGCVAVGLKASTQSQSLLVLLPGSLRLGLVLLGVLGAKFAMPEYGLRELYVWLILFYLFALGLETWMILRPADSASGRNS